MAKNVYDSLLKNIDILHEIIKDLSSQFHTQNQNLIDFSNRLLLVEKGLDDLISDLESIKSKIHKVNSDLLLLKGEKDIKLAKMNNHGKIVVAFIGLVSALAASLLTYILKN